MKSGLGFTNKAAASGAPFPAGSANNGLSVDPVTGVIQLGQLAAGVPGPADLLSDRQIFLQGFTLTFLDSTVTPGNNVRFQGNQIKLNEATFNGYLLLDNQQLVLYEGQFNNQVTINPTDINLTDPQGNFIAIAPGLTEINDLINLDDLKIYPSQIQLVSGALNTSTTIFQNGINITDTNTGTTTAIAINSLSLNDAVNNQQASGTSQYFQVSDTPSNTSNIQRYDSLTIRNNTAAIQSKLDLQTLQLGYPGTVSGIIFNTISSNPVNGAGFEVQNDVSTRIFAVTEFGQIQTIAPAGGVSGGGSWQVGGVVAAAVVLDATRYVETNINGAIVKLAIVN